MSKIEWTGITANPIRARDLKTGKVGWHCVHASEGCRHCYAETMNVQARFLGTGHPYTVSPLKTGEIELFLDEEVLRKWVTASKPKMVFPCSMTDMYADFVPDEWLDKINAAMALSPHTFQVLTKRAKRRAVYFNMPDTEQRIRTTAWMHGRPIHNSWPFPLRNVWHGVSAEDQKTLDDRARWLKGTPAAKRFVSLEPLLGPVAIQYKWLHGTGSPDDWNAGKGCTCKPPLDWIIVGGESGPNARTMHPDWVRAIRDQCAAAGVPFFMKQMSKRAPIPPDLMIREFPHANT